MDTNQNKEKRINNLPDGRRVISRPLSTSRPHPVEYPVEYRFNIAIRAA